MAKFWYTTYAVVLQSTMIQPSITFLRIEAHIYPQHPAFTMEFLNKQYKGTVTQEMLDSCNIDSQNVSINDFSLRFRLLSSVPMTQVEFDTFEKNYPVETEHFVLTK